MTVLTQLARVTVPAGTRTVPVSAGGVAVPVGSTSARITINRFVWPNSGQSVAHLAFQFSLDGGATFGASVPGEATAVDVDLMGGQIAWKGNPDAPSVLEIGLPGDPQSLQRRVRAVLTNTVALDTSIVVEVF